MHRERPRPPRDPASPEYVAELKREEGTQVVDAELPYFIDELNGPRRARDGLQPAPALPGRDRVGSLLAPSSGARPGTCSWR